MCLLMLRGPQTLGELRARSERLYTFDEIASVQSTLERLAGRAPEADSNAKSPSTVPLVALLPRQPGARESRYMHLLAGSPELATLSSPSLPPRGEDTESTDQIARLESELARMTETLATLEGRIAALEAKL